MALFDRIAGLPIEIDSYELEARDRVFASGFDRPSTLIQLHGGGETGVGEDVVYDTLDHIAHRDAGPLHDLTGPSTLGELCELIGGLDLFAGAPPVREYSRLYRRWAYESAALDLALRQAGFPLGEAVGREARPVTFVVSLRIERPPRPDPVPLLLERYPSLRFKLDPTDEWDAGLVAALGATGAVDTVDLKGAYKGTPVDQAGDPALYRMVAEGFPEAWIEDPDLNEATDPVLEPYRDRVTWDAPIHSVEDIVALPFPPKTLNFKPSRFGSLERLFAAYDHCEEQGIAIYGGGQWELGPGRGQIQHLASLFHPGTPNDVAPAAYNIHRLDPPPGLPTSPLPPQPSATGFRWGEEAGS
jgi:hypothetical protein